VVRGILINTVYQENIMIDIPFIRPKLLVAADHPFLAAAACFLCLFC
jgi:hypothetical protein